MLTPLLFEGQTQASESCVEVKSYCFQADPDYEDEKVRVLAAVDHVGEKYEGSSTYEDEACMILKLVPSDTPVWSKHSVFEDLSVSVHKSVLPSACLNPNETMALNEVKKMYFDQPRTVPAYQDALKQINEEGDGIEIEEIRNQGVYFQKFQRGTQEFEQKNDNEEDQTEELPECDGITNIDNRDDFQKSFEQKVKDLTLFTSEKCCETLLCNSSKSTCFHGKNCFKFTEVNNMDPGGVPLQLQNLSYVEQQLISQVHVVISVYKVKGHQYAYSGNVINFPQNISSFTTKLPRKIQDLNNIITVRMKKQTNFQDFLVQGKRVKEALIWLKENNPYYYNIEISEENLNALPLNGNVYDELVCLEDMISEHEKEQDETCDPEEANVNGQTNVNEENSENLSLNFLNVPMVSIPSQNDQLKNVLDWPGIESQPIDEFKSPGYIVKAFPCLFPSGQADLYDFRDFEIKVNDYFCHLMKYKDRRFASHPSFRFFAFNTIMRWRAMSDGNFYVNKHIEMKDMNAAQLKDKLKTSPNFLKQIMFQSANLRGTRSYWLSKMKELIAMVEQIGPPTVFITLSFADLHCQDLFRLLAPTVAFHDLTVKDKRKLTQDNPMIVDNFFLKRIECFISEVLKPKFGVIDYWFRIEYQHRGSPHKHGVYWLRGAPDIVDIKNVSEQIKKEILKFFDTLISAVHPNINQHPAAIHPSQLRLEDIEDLEEDLAGLLNRVQRHTQCTDGYCLRINKTSKLKECRFKFPFELEPCSRWQENDNNELQFVPERNDPLLNKFNRYMIQTWRANMDIAAITSLKDLYRYLTKYIVKPETQSKDIMELVKNVFEKCDENSPVKSVLQKLYIKCCSERDYGAQEVCHLLMNLKLVCSSGRQFVSVNTNKSNEDWQLFLLDQNKKGTTFIDKYVSRTSTLENVSLWHAAKNIVLPSERSRSRQAIVLVYPNLKVVDQEKSEDYCRQQVLLHLPWRNEQEFLKDGLDWKQIYSTNEDYIKRQQSTTKFHEVHDKDDANYEETELDETLMTQEEWMAISRMRPNELPVAVDMGLRDIDIHYNWKESSEFYKQYGDIISIVQFITKQKKANVSFNEHVDVANIELTSEQKKVQMLLDEQILHYKGVNSNQNKLKKRILIQGKAGTGKSLVISAMKSKLNQAFKTKCYLVVASTGVAAVNVGGNTIYSILHVPRQLKDFVPLKGLALKEFNRYMEGIFFLIIDEFSMIGTSLLAFTSRRCQEGKNNFEEDFGGLCVYMFGDINQLPPVSDSALYSDSQNFLMNKLGKSIFENFDGSVIFTECKRQEDNRFQSLLNNISNGTITECDYSLLKTRFTTSVSRLEHDKFKNAVHLFGKKVDVALCNAQYLRELRDCKTNDPLPVLRICAKHNNAQAKSGTSEEAENLQSVLYLSKGCKIMLRTNLWTEKGLVNGAVGLVLDFLFHENAQYPEDMPVVLLCYFDNYKGPALCSIGNCNAVPIPMVTRQWKTKKEVLCSRTQFPVSLSHACTIHKSQGLTLDKAVIDLGPKDIALAMTYVALSRVKSMDGLLLYPFSKQRILNLNNSVALKKRKIAEQVIFSKSL